MTLRVVQVLTDNDRRGAQVFGYELGERMAELDVHVRTVALAAGDVGGLPVDVLGPSRLHPQTLRTLRHLMAEADATAAHGSTTLVACGIAGLGLGRPFVYRQISDPVFWTPTRSKRLRTRAFYRLPAHVVALSPITHAILERRFGVDPGRITVIPNAVDERRFPRASAEDRDRARVRLGLPATPTGVLAYVGALTVEKGVADLIDAAPPDVVVVLAGDGTARSALETQASQRGVDCRFLGSVSDPRDVYAAADVLVLPSRGGDTQPAVLIEAALVERAIVSTNVGAIPEIVIDGQTGVVTEPSDVNGLRRALISLLADDLRRSRLATSARAHALEQFSMSVVARCWVEVLRAAARRTGS